jgi:purine-binding chemotaxis protein CheW
MVTPNSVSSRAGKYVTFQIARRYFAIEAARIRNVMPSAAMIPLSQPIEGVQGFVRINGRNIPVLNLRRRFGLPPRAPGPRSAVILVSLAGHPNPPCVGLIVDKVTEVLDVHDREIRGNVVQLRADGRPYGRPKVLMDVSSLLPPEEIAKLNVALRRSGAFGDRR